jgi:hypothetical protein
MAIIAMIVAVESRFIFRGFHEFCLSDYPASDCADRPLSSRDFASPATSSVNHSRGDLTARVSGIQSRESSLIQCPAMGRQRNFLESF